MSETRQTTTKEGCEVFRLTRRAMRAAMNRLYSEAQQSDDPYEVYGLMYKHRTVADAINILMEEDFT